MVSLATPNLLAISTPMTFSILAIMSWPVGGMLLGRLLPETAGVESRTEAASAETAEQLLVSQED